MTNVNSNYMDKYNEDDIVITDSAKFQEAIDKIDGAKKRLTDAFLRQSKNAERINETKVWTGITAKKMYEKYSELNNNYASIEYSLELYVKFLKKTLEDYTLLNQMLTNNMENMADSLNVNS